MIRKPCKRIPPTTHERDVENCRNNIHSSLRVDDLTVESIGAVSLREPAYDVRSIIDSDVLELLSLQLNRCYEVYEKQCIYFNEPRVAIETVITELEKWLTTEKANYIHTQMETNPGLNFLLTIRPNISCNNAHIRDMLQEIFGSEICNIDNTYLNAFTNNQISKPGHPSIGYIRFGAIPTEPTYAGLLTANEQEESLRSCKLMFPFLEIPSLFEMTALMLAHDSSQIPEVCHADVRHPINIDKTCVPFTFIGSQGGPVISSISECTRTAPLFSVS